MIPNLEALAQFVVSHLDQEPNQAKRAELLEAAALALLTSGKEEEAQKLKATAALTRNADLAQMEIRNLFKA